MVSFIAGFHCSPKVCASGRSRHTSRGNLPPLFLPAFNCTCNARRASLPRFSLLPRMRNYFMTFAHGCKGQTCNVRSQGGEPGDEASYVYTCTYWLRLVLYYRIFFAVRENIKRARKFFRVCACACAFPCHIYIYANLHAA